MGMLELVDRSRLGRGEVNSCKFKSYYPYLEKSLFNNAINIYKYIFYLSILYKSILPMHILDIWSRFMI